MPPRYPTKASSGPAQPPAAALRSTPSSVGGIADSIEVKAAPESATTAARSNSKAQSKRTRKPTQKAAETAEEAALTVDDSDDDDEVVRTRSGRAVKKRALGSIESPTPPPVPKRQASAIYSQASFSPVTEPPAGGSTAFKMPTHTKTPAPAAQAQPQQADQRIKDLEATVAKLKEEAKAKTEELGKTTTAKEEALKLLKTAQQQATSLKEEKAKLVGDIAQAEYQLSKTKEEANSLKAKTNELTARAGEPEKEISSRAQKAATLLEETKQEIRAERDHYYQEQLQALKQKLIEAEQKIIILTEEKKTAAIQSDKLVANLDAAEKKSQQLQDQLDALKRSQATQATAVAKGIAALEQQLVQKHEKRGKEAAERIAALEQQLAQEKEARTREMKEHDEEVKQMLADGEEYRQRVSKYVQHLRETTDVRFPNSPSIVRGANPDGEEQDSGNTAGQQPEQGPSSFVNQPAGQAATAPGPSGTSAQSLSASSDGMAIALATAALQAYGEREEGPPGQN